MCDLPDPLPCWPCVGRAIAAANSLVQGSQDKDLGKALERLSKINCSWHLKNNKFSDGRCAQCTSRGVTCGNGSSLLEKTRSYLTQLQDQPRDLPCKTREGLIAAATTLGIRLATVAEYLQDNNDPSNANDQNMNQQRTEIGSQTLTRANRSENPTESQAESYQHDSHSAHLLSWNGIVFEFHSNVLQALLDAGLNKCVCVAIMGNIPIKWVP
ncbi:hypothetical protein CEP54_000315 [Fusarium duplospermum]|uniref:Uncharacterized protein n=1 Tax=Fusarium duplospermum TaxID=1325734 RepID=A0A428R724_9HYPO|nr:hypothetical protein CEP54_000315 [Fusarium duplospermum]